MENNKMLLDLINKMKRTGVKVQKDWTIFSVLEVEFSDNMPILKSHMLPSKYRAQYGSIVWEEIEIHKNKNTMRNSFNKDIKEFNGYFILCIDR